MVIRRDVVEKIPFERISDYIHTDHEVNCLDIMFCWRCFEKKIVITCDTRINLLHIKEIPEESQDTRVGKEKPIIIFKKT